MNIDLNILSKAMPGVYLWKKDINFNYMEINQDCAALFGIPKKKDISGFSDYDIPCKIADFADTFRQQDEQVMKTAQPLKILEIHQCAENQTKIMLNTKNPLKNENGAIYGTFAYCVDITDYLGNITNLLTQLSVENNTTKRKLLTGSYSIYQAEYDDVLTPRQMDCLFYLLRGKTSKQIAEALGLSPRTVEQYVEQLKHKFSCKNKSELIETAINKGFINVIPSDLFKTKLSNIC